jgi:hypothetical protein
LFAVKDKYIVQQRIENYGRLTHGVSWQDDYPSRGIALLGFEASEIQRLSKPFIQYVSGFRRGRRITSLSNRVTFDAVQEFDPLPLEQLTHDLPAHLRRHLRHGPLSPKTWQLILAALSRHRPDMSIALSSIRDRMTPRSLQSHDERIAAFEQDAVQLALEMSGIGREPAWDLIRESSGGIAGHAPFLANLQTADVNEDQIIQHDAEVFGGWERLRREAVGAVVFESSGSRLTVINVNRHRLEATLGVDLLYYTHAYRSFVLVQYKVLRPEENGWVYRPDKSFASELERMRRIGNSPAHNDVQAFRLSAGACFLKFCNWRLDAPSSTEMIPGYYVPLEYWDALVAANRLTGQRGGMIVTADTLGRHLTNTKFVDLVEHGWVGSSGVTTEALSEIVQAGLQDRKSMILAVLAA